MPFPELRRGNDLNVPGLCHMDIVDVADVVSVPEDVGGNIVGTVVLKDGKSWSRLELMPPGSRFQEAWNLQDGDQIALATAAANVAKDELAKLAKLWRLKNGRYLVLFYCVDGATLLCGNLSYPMSVRVNTRDRGNEEAVINGYQLQFARQHREPVPFYNGTLPSGVPSGCPTAAELIPEMTWAEIEALLDGTQLADAEASICEVPPDPVLCDVIDAAMLAGGTSVVVSGAGTSTVDGTYSEIGTFNGKPQYNMDGGTGEEITWTFTNKWTILAGSDWYESSEDVDFPWEVVTWTPAGGATGPAPTVEQAVAGPLVLLDCLSDPDKEILLDALSEGVEVLREDASGTPVLYSTVVDGGSYTDGRVAIRDTDSTTDLEFIAGGVTQYVLRKVRVQYKDSANATQEHTPKITGIVGSTYGTDLGVIPRFIMYLSDGTTIYLTRDINAATVTMSLQPVKNSASTTVSSHEVGSNGVAPDAGYQLKDSAAANIGSAGAIPSGTSANITAPDATAVAKNSASTTLSTTAIKSNASANITIADSTITKPDATTVGLAATVALDVRNYRAGIVYKRGLDLWSGEQTTYGTGSEGTLFAAGAFDYTPPVYPLSYAELDRTAGSKWITMKANNSFGNTNRFTDEAGGSTYTANLVVDHLTGLMWYRTPATAATWATALSNGDSSSQASYTDWRVPTEDELKTIINNEEANDPLNYAPFSIALDLWVCTTLPGTSTSGRRMLTSTGAFSGLAKTSTAQYILVRTHLT